MKIILIAHNCATKTYNSIVKYRFEMGIKEISPNKFVEMTVHW